MRSAAAAITGFIALLAAAVPAAAGGPLLAPEPPPFARPLPPGPPPVRPPPPPVPFPPGPFGGGRFRVPAPGVRVYLPREPQPFPGPAEGGWPPHGRVCFDQAEARDKIAAHGLADPFRAVRFGRLLGEALSAKLCRWRPDQFVYEIHVLRRDGRILRVFMNAQNGEPMQGGGPVRPPGPN